MFSASVTTMSGGSDGRFLPTRGKAYAEDLPLSKRIKNKRAVRCLDYVTEPSLPVSTSATANRFSAPSDDTPTPILAGRKDISLKGIKRSRHAGEYSTQFFVPLSFISH